MFILLLLLALASSGAQAEPARRTRRDIAAGGDAGSALQKPAACRAEDVAGDLLACAGVQRSLLQNHMKRSQQFDGSGEAHGDVGQRAKGQPVAMMLGNAQSGANSQEVPQSSPDNMTRAEPFLGHGALLAFFSSWVKPFLHRVTDGVGIQQRHDAHFLFSFQDVLLRCTCFVVFFAMCLAIFHCSRQKNVCNSIDKTRPIELTPSVSKLPQPRSHCENLPSAAIYETCGSAIVPRAHPHNNVMLSPPPQLPYSVRLFEQLCPALVVPRGYECLLAVRLFAGRTYDHIAFDILDMHGKAVLKADIAGPSVLNLQSGSPDTRSPLLTLRMANVDGPDPASPADVIDSIGAVCSVCHMASSADLQHHHEVCRFATAAVINDDHDQKNGGSLPRGGSEVGTCIHNAAGEVFGVLTLDPTHPRYVFVGHGVNRSGMRLFFGRNFGSYPTVVTNEGGEHLADTEPTTMPFDPQGKFYRMKVNPGIDVCLVLSALLAIDAMEAHLAAQ